MRQLSFKRHRFPPEIIRHSIWLYAKFTLSFRDVEEMLAERGLDVSYETIRRWFLKFGPLHHKRILNHFGLTPHLSVPAIPMNMGWSQAR